VIRRLDSDADQRVCIKEFENFMRPTPLEYVPSHHSDPNCTREDPVFNCTSPVIAVQMRTEKENLFKPNPVPICEVKQMSPLRERREFL